MNELQEFWGKVVVTIAAIQRQEQHLVNAMKDDR